MKAAIVYKRRDRVLFAVQERGREYLMVYTPVTDWWFAWNKNSGRPLKTSSVLYRSALAECQSLIKRDLK